MVHFVAMKDSALSLCDDSGTVYAAVNGMCAHVALHPVAANFLIGRKLLIAALRNLPLVTSILGCGLAPIRLLGIGMGGQRRIASMHV